MTKPGLKHTKNGARRARALTAQQVRRYPGTRLEVRLPAGSALPDALDQILHGWTADCAAAQSTPRHSTLRHSTLRQTRGGYSASSSYLDETITGLGVAGAACAVIADLAQDFFVTRPGSLALHCGAFRLNGRLVALAGPARAGKSTLTARLCCEPDVQVFCDDVLPVLADGQAYALGIAPRLRLPLPATASAAFRTQLAAMMGPRDTRYGYVCAPGLAPHGTRATLTDLVILDRRAAAPASLHAVTEDEALRYLVSQNMTDLSGAAAALARMDALMATLRCRRLVYSDLDEAVALLRRACGEGDPVAPRTALAPADLEPLPEGRVPPGRIWQRDPEVAMQHRADAAFLWKPGRATLWHLNTLATAIWTLLEIPGSAADIAETLAELFPDQPAIAIAADVSALLAALAEAGMIAPADTVA